MSTYRHVHIRQEGHVLEVALARPEVRNAFNAELIAELTDIFRTAAQDRTLRVLLLSGQGDTFCAGADLHWMRAQAAGTPEENLADARRLGGLFASLKEIPFTTLALVQGAALGGGSGLLACADIGLVEEDAKLGFTEVRLGIVPAVISPFVADRLRRAAMLRYFQTGEIFSGREAVVMGLASEAVAKGSLREAADRILAALRSAAPQACRIAKRLALEAHSVPFPEARDSTERLIANVRASAEAKEGMDAFLNKRPPSWRPIT
jgi:methylglutaconyl-CoA hydratase